ncbi:MAG: sigma-70 family RNA polymerase sigma factor [Fimbriiglobus sp.]
MAQHGLSRWAESLGQTVGQEMARESDQELLQSYTKQQEPEAFRKLVTRYAVLVENSCRQVLRDPADIEDTFQATFLVLLKKAHTLDASRPIGGWLFAVAHRLAVRCKADRLRRQSRETESVRRRASLETSDASWIEVSDFLHRELDSLADKYRQPLLLCAVQGLTRDEAALELGVSLEAIRWRLEKGRELLQQRLTKRGLTLSAGWFTLFMAGSQATDVPSLALITSTLGSLHGPMSSSVASLVQGAFPMFKIQSVIASVVLSLTLLGTGLGFLAATPQEKPTPKPEKPIAQKAPTPAETRPIAVSVLGVDGQPLAGAKLEWHMADKPPQPLGETDATGRFQARVPLKATGYVIARFDDLGLDYLDCTEKTTEAKLKLRKDVPIRGQLKHKDGKPVVGAKVSVLALFDYGDNNIQPFLDGWLKRTQIRTEAAETVKRIDTRVGPVTVTQSDKEGRFEMTNLGSERLVILGFEGDMVAKGYIYVVSRFGFDPQPFEEVTQKIKQTSLPHDSLRFGFHPMLRSPTFSMICELEKVVEGTVRDFKSNQPLTGIKLRLHQRDERETYSLQAVTDAQGRYRIRGARKDKMYSLSTETNLNLGYVASEIDAPDNNSPESIKLDVPCMKGIEITGTLKDKETGLPLEGTLTTKILHGNPALKTSTWLKAYELASCKAGVDGKYRILTIPGLTLIDVEAAGQNAEEFKPVQPDPIYPHLFKKEVNVLACYVGEKTLTSVLTHGCKVFDAKAADIKLNHDFTFERGPIAMIHLEGPDQKPLSRVRVTGYHVEPHYPGLQLGDSSELRVYNVEPGAERFVFANHREKKLVGLLKLNDNAKQTLILGEGATVKGRVLDEKGNPKSGFSVQLRFRNKLVDSMIDTENGSYLLTKTDEAGRFTFERVVPGQEIWLEFPEYTATQYTVDGHNNVWSGQKHGDIVDAGDGVVKVVKKQK